MNAGRRRFLGGALGAGAAGLAAAHADTKPATRVVGGSDHAALDRAAAAPVLKREAFASPVIIDSLRFLKKGDEYFVHVRSKDGAEGVSVVNPPRGEYLDKILKQLVLPFLVGKDARDLEDHLWELYRWKDNYKLQGLALWCPQAWVEFAILDMLGRIVNKPMGALLGDIVRTEVACYVASGRRDTTAQQEVRCEPQRDRRVRRPRRPARAGHHPERALFRALEESPQQLTAAGSARDSPSSLARKEGPPPFPSVHLESTPGGRMTTLAGVILVSLLAAHAPAADLAPAPRAFDARLTQYAYPFPVQMLPIEAQQQSLEIAYMDVPGAQPNGRTVVMLHGKNFSGAYWAPTIRALNAAGYRVIAPDQIGFGKSSKPERFQYTFQQLADLTRTLLDRLGVRTASVVGHSMGGMLATRFALMYPDRVERLVLVNPIGLEDWKRWVPYRTIDDSLRTERAATPDSVRAYMRENYFGGEWKPEYEALVEIPIGWMAGPDRERIAFTSALTTDMVFTQPVLYEFGDLKVPTLLIIGQRDRTAIGKAWAPPDVRAKLGNYPELGRKAREAIPVAQVVEIPNAGHLPQVEQFDAYRRALEDFLSAGARGR